MVGTTPYVPDRGDIIWMDFDPAKGHEQQKRRPALVLSTALYHKTVKLMVAAPITSTARGHRLEVAVNTVKTTGVVMCQQFRSVDYQARDIRFIEQAPAEIVIEVLAKVRAILD